MLKSWCIFNYYILSVKKGRFCKIAKLQKNQFCKIIGCGRTDESLIPVYADNYQQKLKLQEAVIKVDNDKPFCQDPTFNFNLQFLYCLFDDTKTSNRSSVCSGDSGGPMLYKMYGKWYVFGVTSFSYGELKCLTNRPSYYTNVAFLFDWIVNKIILYLCF